LGTRKKPRAARDLGPVNTETDVPCSFERHCLPYPGSLVESCKMLLRMTRPEDNAPELPLVFAPSDSSARRKQTVPSPCTHQRAFRNMSHRRTLLYQTWECPVQMLNPPAQTGRRRPAADRINLALFNDSLLDVSFSSPCQQSKEASDYRTGRPYKQNHARSQCASDRCPRPLSFI